MTPLTRREKGLISVFGGGFAILSIAGDVLRRDHDRMVDKYNELAINHNETVRWLSASHKTLTYLLHLLEEQGIEPEVSEFDMLALQAFLPDDESSSPLA